MNVYGWLLFAGATCIVVYWLVDFDRRRIEAKEARRQREREADRATEAELDRRRVEREERRSGTKTLVGSPVSAPGSLILSCWMRWRQIPTPSVPLDRKSVVEGKRVADGGRG